MSHGTQQGQSGVESIATPADPGRGPEPADQGAEAGGGIPPAPALAAMAPLPATAVPSLVVAGVALGVLGDVLMRAPDDLGLNLSLWISAVGVAAIVVSRRAGLALDWRRAVWLAVGVAFGAALTWRDAPPLKLLALGSATVAFALAASRPMADWIGRAGVVQYGLAVAFGALHAWTAAAVLLLDLRAWTSRRGVARGAGWRRAAGIARGLALVTPLVVVFGALLMSADAVFERLVLTVVGVDLDEVASHVVLFGVAAWLATGYLRGFLTGTEPPILRAFAGDGGRSSPLFRRPTLGRTEVATALTTLDLLFLVFVLVQFRYLFGGDMLVQVTPDLTYADYARRGFFELVFAAFLVVPVLLAADWLLDRRDPRADRTFRRLGGLLVLLMIVVAASALQRLRLYYDNYGLTDSRLYAAVMLLWIGALLLWFAATALRGRREAFAFGGLTSGLAMVAVLFIINPDAIVAGTNLTRVATAGTTQTFDVTYAASLSGDAVPLLTDALPSLPPDVQCPLARQLLRRWPPDRARSLRSWNWSASRAADVVRAREAQLRAYLGPDGSCSLTTTDP